MNTIRYEVSILTTGVHVRIVGKSVMPMIEEIRKLLPNYTQTQVLHCLAGAAHLSDNLFTPYLTDENSWMEASYQFCKDLAMQIRKSPSGAKQWEEWGITRKGIVSIIDRRIPSGDFEC